MRWTRQKLSLWLALILLALAGAAMLFSTLGYAGLGDAWDSWFGPRVNGSWKAVALDGKAVDANNYLVVVKRGVGLFVATGARARLKDSERNRFLNDEWPQIRARMERLGIDAAELLDRERA